MKLNPCGLPEDQFIEIFREKAKFLGKLLVAFHPGTRQVMDEKLAWDMFQECVYAAETEAQDIVDPERKNDPYAPMGFVSREILMDEIKSVNAKVESLVDYIGKLVETTTNGLNGIAETLGTNND
jgi:hypothetical protein